MTISNLSHNTLYLVALSGGADSIALAHMMKQEGLHIMALHCNFHLRGEESNRDEAFVRQFCKEQDIQLEIKHFDTHHSAHRNGVSIEMEARQQRYTWFAQMAQQSGAEAICVAHHRDDQAETLLLNLIRGTGLRGLAAMHPDRTINGLRILRPLLQYTKAQLLDYLKQHGQNYVTDSTNLEREALRNRIRLDLMPMLCQLNPNITECLARTAENVRLELSTDSQESEYFKWLAPYGFTRQQIIDIHNHRPELSIDHTGKQWHSPTHILLMDRGQWVLRQHTEHTTTLPQLNVTTLPCDTKPDRHDFIDRQQAFIDASTIQGPLGLRPIVPGDRFRPYGMKQGTKLVSDYLTDRKVNLLDKKSQLAVVDTSTNRIVWLCGREIDHRNSITPQTRTILRLTING